MRPHTRSNSTQAAPRQHNSIKHSTVPRTQSDLFLRSMATMVALSSFAVGRFAARSIPAAGTASRRRALVVRAQTEPDVEPTKETTAEASAPSPAPTPTPSPAAPKPKPKASTDLLDVMGFSGPAPERINGRLAMVGFVAALSVEAARGGGLLSQAGSGAGLLSQAGSGAGLGWFVTTAALLSVASLVPLLQGQSVESRSDGIWSADAELWNGRFAMLGLVALAVTEFITGAPFVNV